MASYFGQFAATSQFYLYGKKHCTRTGWEHAIKHYPKPDLLEDPTVRLTDHVYLITGANAGIGREITSYLAKKGSTIFMICRNRSRGEAALTTIREESSNNKIHLLIGDCGLEEDIRRLWKEFIDHPDSKDQQHPDLPLRLDGLICNAGAMAHTKSLTKEGVEVTFATHLLYGTYLLTTLALPTLQMTPQSRVIAVSSGGMYNCKFPTWEVATSTGLEKYDGQFAYAYAKRGQVLLMEYWAKLYPQVLFLSCHPGWVQTEAVDAAYGENKSWLQPLRTAWQGAEGIIWLAIASKDLLQSGGFYLDRQLQVKHLAGAFFTEGSFTRNTPEEVQEMVTYLDDWANGKRPSLHEIEMANARKLPLQPINDKVDIERFMGSWYVLAVQPTPFERGVYDSTETYTWDTVKEMIQVSFTYLPSSGSEAKSEMQMRARVSNKTGSQWALSPRLFGLTIPLRLSYLIVDLATDYSYVTVSVPDRSYLWIMTRQRPSAYSTNEHSPAQASVVDVYPGLLDDSSSTPTPLSSSVGSAEQSWERDVLEKAVKRAVKLGFDGKKILRAYWTPQA
eukprot:gene9340-10308_t